MRSLLSPVHWWAWRDARRRALTLLRFAEVEADGGRDLVRAAELTGDPVLRRLFLRHALDEQRHAELFRGRGLALMRTIAAAGDAPGAEWLARGERGLDDVRVDQEQDETLLAFLHLSEKAAARDFADYIAVLDRDPATREVFEKVLHDEAFHMTYTRAQLQRVAPERGRRRIWQARRRRLWRAYLRLASGLAGLIGGAVLTLQYYLIIPPFAWVARRGQRDEPPGWSAIDPSRNGPLSGQY